MCMWNDLTHVKVTQHYMCQDQTTFYMSRSNNLMHVMFNWPYTQQGQMTIHMSWSNNHTHINVKRPYARQSQMTLHTSGSNDLTHVKVKQPYTRPGRRKVICMWGRVNGWLATWLNHSGLGGWQTTYSCTPDTTWVGSSTEHTRPRMGRRRVSEAWRWRWFACTRCRLPNPAKREVLFQYFLFSFSIFF